MLAKGQFENESCKLYIGLFFFHSRNNIEINPVMQEYHLYTMIGCYSHETNNQPSIHQTLEPELKLGSLTVNVYC